MNDKREHAGKSGRLSDEEIDLAARSLVAQGPSKRLSANVMRRLHDASIGLDGFVPTQTLHRWQLAFATLAMVFIAVVALMQVHEVRPPAARVAHGINPSVTPATPPTVTVPHAPPSAIAVSPGPAPASHSHAATRPAEESPAPERRAYTRLVGPRLAERFVRNNIPHSAAWDLMAPAQPDQATVDLLPDVPPAIAPLEVAPLPIPQPVVIPPILIPEIRGRG